MRKQNTEGYSRNAWMYSDSVSFDNEANHTSLSLSCISLLAPFLPVVVNRIIQVEELHPEKNTNLF